RGRGADLPRRGADRSSRVGSRREPEPASRGADSAPTEADHARWTTGRSGTAIAGRSSRPAEQALFLIAKAKVDSIVWYECERSASPLRVGGVCARNNLTARQSGGRGGELNGEIAAIDDLVPLDGVTWWR